MKNDLDRLAVAILDCQTTGATPENGFLLEIAWTILPSCVDEEDEPKIHSFLVSLPDGEIIPLRISRMRGISGMSGDGSTVISPGEKLTRRPLNLFPRFTMCPMRSVKLPSRLLCLN